MGRERAQGAEEAEGASPLLSPRLPGRSGGSFSYALPTFPRNVSVCQLAGGASEEESIAHQRIQRKLIAALCLAFVFMIIEVVGGIYAHSLAIITDAAHLLSDVSGFAVAVLAAYWAKRRSHEHFSYGYHRVEVLGALASVMTVWLVTGILLFEAVQRIINPEYVDGKIMFIVAMAGVACNVLMMAILGHHHGHGGSCSHGEGHGHSHSHSHGGESHGHSHSKAANRSPAGQAAAAGAAPCCGGHSHAAGGVAEAVAAETLPAAAVDLEAGEGEAGGHAHGGGSCCGHSHHGDSNSHSHSHVNGAAEPHSRHSSHSGHSSDEEEHEHEHLHQEGDANGRAPILGGAGHHKHGSSCGGHAHGGSGGGSSGSSGALAVGHSHGHSHSHDHANLNVRGAIIHVIGDFVQSVGVAIAGALIWWHQDDPRWFIADPICTFLFAILVLWTTRAILRDISDVLMERVPRGLCIKSINDNMSRVAGVEEVHDLHVWSLTPGIPLLCAHVNLSPEADPSGVLHELNEYCRSIGIEHSTIQLVVNGNACPCAC